MTIDDADLAPAAELSLATVLEAEERITPYVVRTPALHSERLSVQLGRPVDVKLEVLQHTGSFKVRGAFNRMLMLDAAQRAAGVVAVSGGNHGLAVAYAARVLGVRATVIMPSTTVVRSVLGARGEGAEVILTDTIAAAFVLAHQEAASGRVLIHPFDDAAVIAGQGTLGLELLDDVPETTDVIASIGGGGMIAGLATALKGLRGDIRVWGVETVGADAMSRALTAGRPVTLQAITSIAKTLGAPAVSDRTLAIAQSSLEDVIVVSDAEAVRAIDVLATHLKVVTEPAAACTWAAALQLADRLPADAHVTLVLCGGNVGLDDIAAWRGLA